LDWGKDKIDEGVKRVNFHFGVTEDSLNQLLRLGVVGHEVIEKRFFDTPIFDLAQKWLAIRRKRELVFSRENKFIWLLS